MINIASSRVIWFSIFFDSLFFHMINVCHILLVVLGVGLIFQINLNEFRLSFQFSYKIYFHFSDITYFTNTQRNGKVAWITSTFIIYNVNFQRSKSLLDFPLAAMKASRTDETNNNLLLNSTYTNSFLFFMHAYCILRFYLIHFVVSAVLRKEKKWQRYHYT